MSREPLGNADVVFILCLAAALLLFALVDVLVDHVIKPGFKRWCERRAAARLRIRFVPRPYRIRDEHAERARANSLSTRTTG